MNHRLAFFTMVVTLSAIPAAAQQANTCRFICELEWKIEPTFTIPARLIRNPRPMIHIIRVEPEDAGGGRDYAPFHYWLYQ